jgi:hypothetical protein
VQDARVVHQHGDLAERVRRLLHRPRPVVLGRHVQAAVERGVAQLVREPLPLLVPDVGDHHPRAFGDEPAGRRRALAARGAGDDRDLAVQTTRGHISSSVSGIITVFSSV